MHFLQCLGQKQFKKYCFEFEEAERASQGTSAIEAKKNNEGLDQAAALYCKELHWATFLTHRIYSCVELCRTLNNGGNWQVGSKL